MVNNDRVILCGARQKLSMGLAIGFFFLPHLQNDSVLAPGGILRLFVLGYLELP
uniref:Uncharacterized protein n=1 Tax=Lepeophtheirus salmonis TaxID=72036 RepID=A0A0K2UST5_LEPSM